MDDKKKMAAIVGVIVVAVAALAFSFRSSGIAGEQGKAVGSLEEGVNKESGLPLNPPKNDVSAGNPAGAGGDPSMPAGN